METKKVLIGSVIRQSPEILSLFLQSLEKLKNETILVNYFFIDDNTNSKSKNVLKEFIKKYDKSIIEYACNKDNYVCDEYTHRWNENLIWKVANYKNKIINYCIKNSYDYLFLIDSDIILHPKTLVQLVSTNKDIISEIFWTKWSPDMPLLPQVWLYDQYSMSKEKNDNLNVVKFIEKLKKPGIYEIGGLGACTLITSRALKEGVSYDEIKNVSFWGEDRHFSIRAAVHGFKLFVDTNYPAYHIYRSSNIKGAKEYMKNYIDNRIYKKNLSHDNNKIITFVKEFIEKYLSCDYRIITGYEGYDYLSLKYISKLKKVQNEMVDFLKQNKIKCNASILQTNVQYIKPNEAKVKVGIKIQIKSIQGKSIKKFEGEFILNNCEKPKCKVDFISFNNNKGQNLLGFCIADLLKEKVRISKDKDNKITLAMLVSNEAGKFLERILTHAKKYIDNAIILDDASKDNTVDI